MAWYEPILPHFYTTAVVDIVSRYGLSNDVCHKKQPDKSNLVLYRVLIHNNSHLKQLYICTKTEHFGYKYECARAYTYLGIKRRAGLGYR